MNNDELFCIEGEDTIESSVEELVHDHEPGRYTIVEYQRLPVKSRLPVRCAFEYLEEMLQEDFGAFENGKLHGNLDFSRFKSELEKYIDANLVNWNCKETGHEFDIIVDEDGDWIEV